MVGGQRPPGRLDLRVVRQSRLAATGNPLQKLGDDLGCAGVPDLEVNVVLATEAAP